MKASSLQRMVEHRLGCMRVGAELEYGFALVTRTGPLLWKIDIAGRSLSLRNAVAFLTDAEWRH